MEFPLVFPQGGRQCPADARCLVCGRSIGDRIGYISMTVGASLLETEHSVADVHEFNRALRTDWSFFYHGKPDHRGLEATSTLDVVPDLEYGQARILFCSAVCVRNFFDSLCNALDAAVSAADARFVRGD